MTRNETHASNLNRGDVVWYLGEFRAVCNVRTSCFVGAAERVVTFSNGLTANMVTATKVTR